MTLPRPADLVDHLQLNQGTRFKALLRRGNGWEHAIECEAQWLFAQRRDNGNTTAGYLR